MEIELILLLILILILVNGYFAAAEMALVSLSKNKINEMVIHGHKKAKLLQKVKGDSTRYLSTIQVAITLAGFLSSALAGSNLADNFVRALAAIGIIMPINIAVVFITIILSYITLVFGELVPKRIALLNPGKFALSSARVVYVTMIITKPAVWLLSKTTKLVLRIFGISEKRVDDVSENEIKGLIRHGHDEGLYQTQEKEMLENIFVFDDIHAEAIMTPRTNVYAIDIEDDPEQIMDEIIQSTYSRIPIYQDNIDNILGIIHIKDVLIHANQNGFENIQIKELLREPYYVPTSIKINNLFKRMQETNHQMAIILDDYGGMEGVVTIEDLIEEIVGNIYDEYDPIEEEIKQISDSQYMVNGTIAIQDLNRYLGLNVSQDYETLSGLIIEKLEYIPRPDQADVVQHENLMIEVKSVVNNRIEKVLITIEKEQ
ncbi:MAG TPA: hemolysin family protein [Candidatus Izemoplasmatales bacterium]|nr:hemolysin family protein [Candidatus Izemoplasmatales bacterium]